MPHHTALVVKLSSLGDVIHQFPALTDLARHRPDVAVDWAVEEAYAALVALHPAVHAIIPVALRRLRASPGSAGSWRALLRLPAALRARPYSWAIDSQGLLKSALLARLARAPRFGYDASSIREPLAASLLDVRVRVSRKLHAVERIRRLFAEIFGYEPPGGPPDYGLRPSAPKPPWAPDAPYVVALHATSRADKQWAEDNWARLASRLGEQGVATVYPAGTTAERAAAERLAAAAPKASVAPPLTLSEAAALLRHAAAVVGVDTGLAHLGAALGRPTVGVYVATDPALTGLHGGGTVANLGRPGHPPSADAVLGALAPHIGPRT